MNKLLDDEIRYKLLSLLKNDPTLTQREMKQYMGVSLGKINFCISALIQKGMIRVERFKNNLNKSAYLYNITPLGLRELSHLTLNFLKVKLKEYDQIKKEIESLSDQIKNMDIDLQNDLELWQEVKSILL